MKTAFVFPGQGSQFPGMARDLYQSDEKARALFERADELLGFRITGIMFDGQAEDLLSTNVTQPAVFLHSAIAAICGGIKPDMVAGHSLGEFSALAASGALAFEDALRLVAARAEAMQRCCEKVPGAMAAVIKAEDSLVEEVCRSINGTVVPANFNSEGQIVISGEESAVDAAIEAFHEAGIRKAIKLKVGGAFHSPLMEPARAELAKAIEATAFHTPECPIYQNVDALPHTDPEEIKKNLLMQLTSPVRWTQTVRNMAADGATSFIEVGPGETLRNLVRRIVPDCEAKTFGQE